MNRVRTCEDGGVARSPEDCICDRPSNQCPYCGYDTGHNEVCIAAERDRLRADVERLTRDLDAKDTEWRLQERLKDRAIAERDRLARENSRMRAGLELIAARDTPEGLIARETLAGRGPMPATETFGRLDEGKLWSFLRDVITQGCAIESDTRARGRRYEEHSARLDAASRDAVPQFFQRLGLHTETSGGIPHFPSNETLARQIASDPDDEPSAGNMELPK